MAKLALFETVEDTDERLIVVDIGHDQGYPSMTNAIEKVVDFLFKHGKLTNEKSFYYYDSDNQLTSVLHKDGNFLGFGVG